MRWGTEAGLRELLGEGIASLQVTARHGAQRDHSACHYVERHRAFFGPVAAAFEALDAAHHEPLMAALVSVGGRDTHGAVRLSRSGGRHPLTRVCKLIPNPGD
jgi:hypothetical protein